MKSLGNIAMMVTGTQGTKPIMWAEIAPKIHHLPKMNEDELIEFLGKQSTQLGTFWEQISMDRKADLFMWANEHWMIDTI